MYDNTGYGRNCLLSSPLTHLDVISCDNSLFELYDYIISNFLCFVNYDATICDFIGVGGVRNCRKVVDKRVFV